MENTYIIIGSSVCLGLWVALAVAAYRNYKKFVAQQAAYESQLDTIEVRLEACTDPDEANKCLDELVVMGRAMISTGHGRIHSLRHAWVCHLEYARGYIHAYNQCMTQIDGLVLDHELVAKLAFEAFTGYNREQWARSVGRQVSESKPMTGWEHVVRNPQAEMAVNAWRHVGKTIMDQIEPRVYKDVRKRRGR